MMKHNVYIKRTLKLIMGIDFHSQCIVESNSTNTSMYNISMMKHNVYIKHTLKLIMGINQTLGKRQTHSNNVGLMDHPINIYIIIYLSIWYLYIIQGDEHTGDARLRQHKLDEDEEEEEEDVYTQRGGWKLLD
jgi:hypothetical protein